MPKASAHLDQSQASLHIDNRIAELGGWRGQMLAHIRTLILSADDGIVEEWKWSNPVWSYDGIICTGEAYKAAIKTTFPRGAALADPTGLFNSSLEGATRRAIDFKESAILDEAAFVALIRAAIACNKKA